MGGPNENKATKRSASKMRLARMATFLAAFQKKVSDAAAHQNTKQTSSATDAPAHVLDGEVGQDFYKLCYADRWVDMDFPWIEWEHTPEARLLFSDRQTLGAASEIQISHIITTIIRSDRFADGTLERAYDTGLIPSLLQRVNVLASVQDVAKAERKISKNKFSIEQMIIACRHVNELIDAGVSENMAIRNLELFTDVYAKIHSGGSPSPHHVNQVALWSVEAQRVKNPESVANAKDHFRVEHGTPRRQFARLTMKLYRGNQLNVDTLNELVKSYWKLAVITIEEDRKLNKLAKSKLYDTPEARWAVAGIVFPS